MWGGSFGAAPFSLPDFPQPRLGADLACQAVEQATAEDFIDELDQRRARVSRGPGARGRKGRTCSHDNWLVSTGDQHGSSVTVCDT